MTDVVEGTTSEPNPWASPHLQGLQAPVFEERDDEDLHITGEIPEAISGMFVRNGPNPQFAPIGEYHPFDGDAMLHAVYFEDGKARYRNRWLESRGLLAERARGKACYGGLSNYQIPPGDVIAEGGMIKNTGNTAMVRHAGRMFAMLEASKPTEFDADLHTLGEHDFAGKLSGPMTAHPRVDPATGDMLFFGYSPMSPYLRYHEVNATGELTHSVEIEIPSPAMMHDFAITENYAIFFDAPAVFDLDALLSGREPMSWQPDLGTRIGVLARGGQSSDVQWFDMDNCYVVHFFNAFESGDTIEIRAPRMAEMPGGFEFENPGGGSDPMPWKWVLDLKTGRVTDGQTDDLAGEFPRINEAFTGRKNRYGYECPARDWEFGFDFHGVVKYDNKLDTSDVFFYADTEVSGEHVFVPDPDGTAEDDGWLMTMVADKVTEKSELAILDARDVSAGPIARVQMPARVPLGFHANWFASEESPL